MSNYTSEEVKAAVEKIVLSTVTHPTGVMGNRDTNTSFNEIQEAAAGVFVLYYNAPFYVVMLGCSRLLDAVQVQSETIISLLEAVNTTGKYTTPVEDISPLANALSALNNLNSAVSARAKGFQDIEQVPAYRAYASSVNQFLLANGGNIKGVGADGVPGVTDTPQGARAQIPSLITSLQSQHQELIRRATLLANAIEDFGSMQLPQVAAQGVLSRSGDVLRGHYDELSSLSPESRLLKLRSIVLDLLTQQPLVLKYGAALAPSEYIATEKLARAYSDATHLASPAVAQATKYSPYPITAANQMLQLTMDGGVPFEYPMPLGAIATIEGTVSEPFVINSSNDQIHIAFGPPNALVTYAITLATGTRSAQQISGDINTVISATTLRCEPVFLPLQYSAPMNTTSLGGNHARFTVLGGSLTGLGITVGGLILILSGPDAALNYAWIITAVDVGGQYIDADGGAPITPTSGVDVKVGPVDQAVRLIDTAEDSSLAQRRIVYLPDTSGVGALAVTTLGWFPGIQSQSLPVHAKGLVDNINKSTSLFGASVVFYNMYYAGSARSDSIDSTKVVLSLLEAEGTITGGTNAIFTASAPFDLASFTGDMQLVIRATSTPADLEAFGNVASVVGQTISVTFPNPISAGAVTIEVGPSNLGFEYGSVLNITNGSNQGRYVVQQDQGDIEFELFVAPQLPIPLVGALPVHFDMTFGVEYVSFSSKSNQVSSQVVVNNGVAGTGAEYFFNGIELPISKRGTTSYLNFDTMPLAAISDLVQLYEVNYYEASRVFTIAGVDVDANTLQITPEIESTALFSFKPDIQPPFGRIRVAKVADFNALSTLLSAWVADPRQQLQFFRDLSRYLNPVLLNKNPTPADINTAANQLKELLAYLTLVGADNYSSPEGSTLEYALKQYDAPVEPEVVTLLTTFRNKGCDRAVDLLLEGQFSVFFNLDADTVSYSGALLKSARDVALNDLPVRKTNRRLAGRQRLIGTIPNQKDFEFDSSDADSPDNPDIPVGPDIVTPGASY